MQLPAQACALSALKAWRCSVTSRRHDRPPTPLNNFVTFRPLAARLRSMENLATFIQAAAGAGFIAKMIVDGIKMAVDMPRWMPVLLAFIAAQAGEFLLLLSQGAVFNNQVIAQAVVIGLIAWGLTIGVTELQKKANKTEERLETALAMPEGSSKSDVEKVMKENA